MYLSMTAAFLIEFFPTDLLLVTDALALALRAVPAFDFGVAAFEAAADFFGVTGLDLIGVVFFDATLGFFSIFLAATFLG